MVGMQVKELFTYLCILYYIYLYINICFHVYIYTCIYIYLYTYAYINTLASLRIRWWACKSRNYSCSFARTVQSSLSKQHPQVAYCDSNPFVYLFFTLHLLFFSIHFCFNYSCLSARTVHLSLLKQHQQVTYDDF
jgi:hypothetical protein